MLAGEAAWHQPMANVAHCRRCQALASSLSVACEEGLLSQAWKDGVGITRQTWQA